MNAFDFIKALDNIEDDMICQLVSRVYAQKRGRSLRRVFKVLVAATLIISALGLTAYAVSSFHQRQQEQLRERYRVEQNNISSYVEYPEPGIQPGVSLVSAISDGNTQHVYVNISPVAEETVRKSIGGFTFAYTINDEGIRMAGIAYDLEKRDGLDKVELFDGDSQQYIDAPDPEQLYQLILEEAYDPETQTLTLNFEIPLSYYGEMYPLQITMMSFDDNMEIENIYGTVTLELTAVQSREIIFPEPYAMENVELGQTGHIVGLTVYPIGATVYLDIPELGTYYEKAEHTSEEYQKRHSWVLYTDKIYKDFKLIFSDRTELLLMGANSSTYENGLLAEKIQWGSTIDIDDIVALEIMGKRIVLQ